MRNFTIGRVWGIPIRINVSLIVFLPILAWLLGSGTQIGVYTDAINALWPGTLAPGAFDVGARSWTVGVLASVGLFASVAIHELGHSYMARRYGIEVESITLWLLGGLASLSAMPKEWRRELWIALAGPATSLALVVVFAAALQVAPASAPVVVFTLGFLAVVNLVLAAFNMLPAFPMDGGRVLRAVLARNRSYASATLIAARVGTVFAILFAVIGFFSNPILLLLALFVYFAATTESRTVLTEELLEGITVRSLANTTASVDAGDSAEAVLEGLLAARRTDLLVRDGDDVSGVVTAGALRSLERDEYATTTAGTLATDDLPRVDADAGAFDALVALGEGRSDVALVKDAGRVVGAVSQADLGSALALRRGTMPA